MKDKIYTAILTVKVKVPKGYKPASLTYKFGYVLKSRNPELLERIKSDRIKEVKTELEEVNSMSFEVTATFDIIPVTGFCANYLDPNYRQVNR